MKCPARLRHTASAFAITVSFASSAFAADAPAPANAATPAAPADAADASATDAADADGITTILVQAQRRTESARDVPLALSVVTGDTILSNDGIKRTSDIVKLIPNASAASTEGPERPRWFIRGIGTNNTGANTVNPIGIYYDDVYIANVYNQGLPLYDVDHVEALNGPQGTLWGKNSNGGAISFVSKAPTFDPDGYAKVGYGSFNERQVQGAVSDALTDKLAGRLSFYYDGSDGWQKNLYDGRTLGGGDDVAARAQLLLHASDTLTASVNLHIRRFDGTTRPSDYIADSVAPLTAGTAAQKSFLSVFPDGLPHTSGYGEVNLTNPGIEKLDEKGAQGKVVWDPGYLTVTSISGFETNKRTQTTAYGSVPSNSAYAGTPFSQSYSEADYWQASQELRIASPSEDRFTWLGGLYFFDENLSTQAASANYIRGTVATANAWGTGPQFTKNPYNQDWLSYSAFGNVGYKITDDFKISGGLRWSRERTSIQEAYYAANTGSTASTFISNLPQTQYWLYSAPKLFSDSQAQVTRSWTYDITPEYKINENVLSYFRYAHGVLPGGYTVTGYVAVPGTTVKAVQLYRLNPEELDSYEVGLKTNWFNNKLEVDLTGFHYDYTNAVVNVPTIVDPTNPSSVTVLFRNAGAEEVWGGELRADAAPIHGLHVGGTLGLLNTKYTGDTGSTATILGAQAPRSPHVSLTAYANYDQHLPWGGDVIYSVDGSWRSQQYFYPTIASQISSPDPLLKADAYGIVNASIAWQPRDDGKLSFEFSVQNLTDTKYVELGLPVANGSVDQRFGQPRSFFFSVTDRF
ncbi:MAG: TonB-dependent receptor [Azospirillaceae bacterium]|nr:TonB-dependent receptor [Azospirillaceae bacterium]